MTADKLTYLIDFIDDDSFEIRNEIIKQLLNYGFELEDDLKKYQGSIDSEKMSLIIPVLEENRRTWIKENWDSWKNLESDYDKIETSLNLLSKFHYGINYKPDLTQLLDELAEEFKNKIPYGDELDLSFFLFKEKQILGSKDDYNNPFNCNPVYTIKERKGLPITLSLIYVLVGNRLGFSIKGCNYPGHFLAKVEFDNELIFVDCFGGGKVFFENDLENLLKGSEIEFMKMIMEETSAESIIHRVINNLINSYLLLNDFINVKFFRELNDQTKR
jgi:regulator of sirC expression with transglutaminase-like and TPR domain